MVYRSLDRWLVLNNIDCQPYTFSECSELVIHRLDLNGVEWNECRLTRTLIAHILDAVDSSLFLVDHYRVNVATEDNIDSRFVASRGGPG